ncbi:M23 family metallopeptidase [Cohnella pontilimi]|uniref:M23 family metallopeptidase n=1 Tax=Cohnella pontilimi TaxID=2564100 RepID=A0A4U0F9Y8_9BACL|nr:M23 family metallopeptidase [Cohnella pontilimi]TJY41440.1 M23 family metallopeptidase [Cohnella pontilimi]
MEIRDNVRRRRRERMEKLLGELPVEISQSKEERKPPEWLMAAPQAVEAEAEPDPEKWWKEQQRRHFAETPAWSGIGQVTPQRSAAPRIPSHQSSGSSSFAKSFAIRIVIAAVVYGAAWGWFQSGLPGSSEAKAWTVHTVTTDMDFRAIEVWYERTFGGSPAFLPIFRNGDETQAVSGSWNRESAVMPVEGRVVQTFAQDGSGVRIAAKGGSSVKAVYAGRILQVMTESGGKSTVIVQHAGRIVTVYGNLASADVKAGDWVEAGQRLGSMPVPLNDGGESLLIFAVKQNGNTVDPAEVVPFD